MSRQQRKKRKRINDKLFINMPINTLEGDFGSARVTISRNIFRQIWEKVEANPSIKSISIKTC